MDNNIAKLSLADSNLIGRLLVEDGIINYDQLQTALAEQKQKAGSWARFF